MSPKVRKTLVPENPPRAGSQRYVYLAIMYSSKAAGLATTGLYVRNLLASST
jgi:hypothetical protein